MEAKYDDIYILTEKIASLIVLLRCPLCADLCRPRYDFQCLRWRKTDPQIQFLSGGYVPEGDAGR
jgi:hypothetical protein